VLVQELLQLEAWLVLVNSDSASLTLFSRAQIYSCFQCSINLKTVSTLCCLAFVKAIIVMLLLSIDEH